MNTEICPYCNEEIADGALKCKHCKSLLTNQYNIININNNYDNNKTLIISGWLIAIIGTFLAPLLAFIGIILGILIIIRGKGNNTGSGVGIMVTSVILGILFARFWSFFNYLIFG